MDEDDIFNVDDIDQDDGEQIDLELEVLDDDSCDGNKAPDEPVVSEPPPSKRRKINETSTEPSPQQSHSASTSMGTTRQPAKVAAKAAAATVSFPGLRSFFRTLAPGETLAGSMVEAQRPANAPPSRTGLPNQAFKPSTSQQFCFDAIKQLGPMQSVHLVGLLMGDNRDLSSAQRLAFKAHSLWGKCNTKLHKRSSQDLYSTIETLLENGYLVRDGAGGELRCWDQPNNKRSHPAPEIKPPSHQHGSSSREAEYVTISDEDETDEKDEKVTLKHIVSNNDTKPLGRNARLAAAARQNPAAQAVVSLIDPFSHSQKLGSSIEPRSNGFAGFGAPGVSSFSTRRFGALPEPKPVALSVNPSESSSQQEIANLKQFLPIAASQSSGASQPTQPAPSSFSQFAFIPSGTSHNRAASHQVHSSAVPVIKSPATVTNAVRAAAMGMGSANKRQVNSALPPVQKKPQLTHDQYELRNQNILNSLDLAPEQKRIVERALYGHNFFFTGAAGTGKSFALRELVKVLRMIHDPSTVYVTAPTGVAACNVSGSTLHSFAGIGIGHGTTEQLVAKVFKSQQALARWREARVLVIDEISMLSGELFEKLEEIARRIRKCQQPFGGLQLIVCGDFFQLPPVRDAQNPQKFCFQVDAWRRVIQDTIVLKQVWRQKDQEFIELLSELREGRLSDISRAKLNACVGRNFTDQIRPTRLYPRRDEVESTNQKHLQELQGPVQSFRAKDSERYPNSPFLAALQESCPAPTVLNLKLNSAVILLKNLSTEDQLVNGSRGIVVGFDPHPDPEEKTVLPRVLFDNGKTRVILPAQWATVIGQTEMCKREQLPLNLAWALSIHKAQGMTISRVEIDLRRTFEDGQAYVALSRATSLEGLRLVAPVEARMIRANQHVLEYYNSLQNK